MPEFTVKLNSDHHRTIRLNQNISSDEDYTVTTVYKDSPSGNRINYLVIQSNKTPKAFTDMEIAVDNGVKIPPTVS